MSDLYAVLDHMKALLHGGVASVEDVAAVIALLRELAPIDDESAHGYEDNLWVAVLTAIAGGAALPELLAAEALKTRDISFARWCG